MKQDVAIMSVKFVNYRTQASNCLPHFEDEFIVLFTDFLSVPLLLSHTNPCFLKAFGAPTTADFWIFAVTTLSMPWMVLPDGMSLDI